MDCQTVYAASATEPGTDQRSASEEAFTAILRHAVTVILDWQERAGQRRQLSGLDPQWMKHAGLDPADAYREASKPFWRP